MKRYLYIFIAAFIIGLAGLNFVIPVKTAQATFNNTPFIPAPYTEPGGPVCVEGQPNVVDNQKFSRQEKIIVFVNVSYRWHITNQTSDSVTYQLQVDVNPTPTETWINVNGVTRVFEIPDCEPQPCDELDEYEVLQDKVVVPCEEPTPTPTPGDPGTPPTVQGSTVEAPVCPDRTTVSLPANVHVLREGSNATVNFFITDGDSANIYWRVVGSANWQNAVADVKPNADKFVSYTVHELDANLGYDFGVQQKVGCGGGQLVTAVVVDGPATQLFPMNYWEWSK